VEPDSSNKIKCEYNGYLGLAIQLILQLFVSTCFVVIDFLFSLSLHVIAEHSDIDYVQEGVHDLNITVKGHGFVANLVRNTVARFNWHKKVNASYSTQMCLPKPHFLDTW
jgi:hypothetical protein